MPIQEQEPRKFTAEELGVDARIVESAKVGLTIGVDEHGDRVIPNWADICSRKGLNERAKELGHPKPTEAKSDEIAVLGSRLYRLAHALGHPNPGNATRHEITVLLKRPDLITATIDALEKVASSPKPTTT